MFGKKKVNIVEFPKNQVMPQQQIEEEEEETPTYLDIRKDIVKSYELFKRKASKVPIDQRIEKIEQILFENGLLCLEDYETN